MLWVGEFGEKPPLPGLTSPLDERYSFDCRPSLRIRSFRCWRLRETIPGLPVAHRPGG